MADININLALRCPICQEAYSEPKQLNCGHSFCLPCLEGSQHLYSINCPICRKATCFNAPGLSGLRLLPNNYALAQIVEAVIVRQDENTGKIDNNEEMEQINLESNEKPERTNFECGHCGRNVTDENGWFCGDCQENGEKLCSICIVDRHRGSHRCVRISDVPERWKAISCRLDTLNSGLNPIRTSLRQTSSIMSNISLKSARELEKRSDFLYRVNETMEETLEKAESMRSSPADCKRLIDLEYLLNKLEIYVSSYGIRLTILKENVEETCSSLNKILTEVDELEKMAMESETKSILENVLITWKSPSANCVSLAGSFTRWKPIVNMVKYKDEFISVVQLPKGRHQFKFLVDGEWKQSGEYETCRDGCGGWNNFLGV